MAPAFFVFYFVEAQDVETLQGKHPVKHLSPCKLKEDPKHPSLSWKYSNSQFEPEKVRRTSKILFAKSLGHLKVRRTCHI